MSIISPWRTTSPGSRTRRSGSSRPLGLGPEALGTRRAAIIAECRVRYLRELRVGDLLSIRSGVISADEGGLALGHEVVDAGTARSARRWSSGR